MSHPAPEQIRPERTGALEELTRDPSSRKRFLKLMGGGAGATSAFGLLLAACGGDDDSNGSAAGGSTSSGMGTTTGTTGDSGDLEIVNYALTLEYLEADFYAKVIDSGLFKGAQLDLIKVIGEHEQQHVDALTATVDQLGGTPAAKPETKFPLDSAKSVLSPRRHGREPRCSRLPRPGREHPEQGGPCCRALDPHGRGEARLRTERADREVRHA